VTTNLSPYELARLAECASPDAPDSPGARFLLDIADAVAELEPAQVADLSDLDMLAHDVADGAVEGCPYSHDLWMTFVDLAAYREFDGIASAAEAVADGNPDGYAASMLYSIGYRLARRLLDKSGASA
jgi:hypothetical protein